MKFISFWLEPEVGAQSRIFDAVATPLNPEILF